VKAWGGRFKKDLSAGALKYTASSSSDELMILDDLWGSETHAIMLAKSGIISLDECKKILHGLEKIKKNYASGKYRPSPEFEDIHMNIEAELSKHIGETAGKLHTARSRNDQVLVDTKLHLREELLQLAALILQLQKTVLSLAERNLDTVMPGYTHTQRAQPITCAFWLTSYASALSRDVERVLNAYKNVNTNPLGACALAGTSFPINRKITTKLLGFDSTHEHALDVVSSRDFVVESISVVSILMSNLSRLAEELVLWSTSEFGFVEIDDKYATGSSIMPQKKNPDIAELLRSRTGVVFGSLISMLTILKGLPSGYSRDLQEDKPLLWNSLEIAKSSLKIFNEVMKTIKVNQKRMLELSGKNFSTSTELANYLVRKKGLTFRESHKIVGKLVEMLIRKKKDLSDTKEVIKILKSMGISMNEKELEKILSPASAVASYKSTGGTSPVEVKRMINAFKKEISAKEKTIADKNRKIGNAKKLTEKTIREIC